MGDVAESGEYSDARLAALYDTLNQWAEDTDFYVALAGKTSIRILDAGCGTGLLAAAYARSGHHVVGLDPAPPMLAAAHRRPGGERVDWRQGTLQAFVSSQPFDLVVMTGHAFQCLLTDEDILGAFQAVRACLAVGGRFVFETRHPAARAWERWTPARTQTTGRGPDGRRFENYHQLIEVSGEVVRFASYCTIEEEPGTIRSTSRLRFAPLPILQALAAKSGLAVETVYGDWDRSALVPSSPEMIFTLRPALAGGRNARDEQAGKKSRS